MARILPFLLLGAVIVIAVTAGSSLGQNGGSGSGAPGDSTGVDSTAVDSTAADSTDADSTAAAGSGSESGFHPSYGSSYEVNKQVKAWNQTLKLDQTVGRLRMASDARMALGRDVNRGNRRTRTGDATVSATMDIGSGFSAGLEGKLRRQQALDQRTRTEEDNASADIVLSYLSKSDWIETLLSGSAGVVRNDVYGEASLSRGPHPSDGFSSDSTQVDSTAAFGASGRVTAKTTFKPKGPLSGDVTLNVERSSLDSKVFVIRRGRDEQTERSSAPNDNSAMTGNLHTEYVAGQQSKIVMDLRGSRREEQYYLVQQGTETRSVRSLGGEISANWKLPLGLGGRMRLSKTTSDQEYDVLQDRGTSVDDQSASAGLSRRFPLAIDASADFTVQLKQNTYYVDRLTPNDVRIRDLKGSLRREVSPRVSLAATGSVSLISLFYHPASGDTRQQAQAQDRDDYRQLLDFTATYKPNPKFDTSASVQRTETRTVNIRAAASGNNVVNERYQVLATLGYAMTPTTRISQRYSISANYSFFVFAEDRNSLTRETKVTTQVTSQVSPRVMLQLDHDFRFRDSGAYTQDDTPGAPWLYGRSLKDTQQSLATSTRYQIIPQLTLQLRQLIENRWTEPLSGSHEGNVSRTLRLELIEGAEFNHGFDSGLSVGGRFNRTDSYIEQPGNPRPQKERYWVAAVSVNKNF